jgi:UDP-3-O-[3-hydroxymyristoyl] glucosamine N-acyltransferase
MPTLAEIARIAGAAPPPDGGRQVGGFASLEDAGPSDLAAAGSEKVVPLLRRTAAGFVLVSERLKLPRDLSPTLLPVADAEVALAQVVEACGPPVPHPPPGVHPSAVIDESAKVDAAAHVGPRVVIGARSIVAAGCRLHAGVVIGEDCRLGEDCTLFPNVVLRERVALGRRVTIHAGSVIGSDGFGYRWDGEKHRKIPQIGGVEIGDDCELGSCTCIDRAKLATTRIGAGTKIDNLVQIGHNAQLGPHCLVIGQTGIAGSATLGEGTIVGGQAAIRDHVTLGDHVQVAARGAVAEDVPSNRTVGGTPAMPQRQYLREQAALRRLPELIVQVRQLQAEIKKLRGE